MLVNWQGEGEEEAGGELDGAHPHCCARLPFCTTQLQPACGNCKDWSVSTRAFEESEDARPLS